VLCVVSRGLCVGLITSSEECCRVWCVTVTPQQWRGPGPLATVVSGKENLKKMHSHITSVIASSDMSHILHTLSFINSPFLFIRLLISSWQNVKDNSQSCLYSVIMLTQVLSVQCGSVITLTHSPVCTVWR